MSTRVKKTCSYCNACRHCKPLDSCERKANHVNWKREAKKSGTHVAQQDQCSRAPASKRSKNIGRKIKSSMRGRHASSQPIADESNNNQEVAQQELNPKARLTKVCEALDIDAKILNCPSNGFAIESLEQSRTSNRAKKS